MLLDSFDITTDNLVLLLSSGVVVLFLFVIVLMFRFRHRFSEQQAQQQLLKQERDGYEGRLNEKDLDLKSALESLQKHQEDVARLGIFEARWQDSQSTLEMTRKQYDALRAEHSKMQLDHEKQQTLAHAENRSLQEKIQLLQTAREQLSEDFEKISRKIYQEQQQVFSSQSQQTLQQTVDPLKEQLSQFRKKVEDVYDKESSQRNALMGRITELQQQTRQIGEDAINLTRALKGDNKMQGGWGEVILERILEESGLQKGREYDLQVALSDEEGKRRNPDAIIRLPENKDIVVDSKVSLIHYEQYCNAETDEERNQQLKLHVSSLRNHVNQLSIKSYESLEGIRTLDFVFIFVPVEAAFLAAAQADMQLFSDAYNKQVIIVSPTTLLATLRTVENLWRFDKQNKNASEIANIAGGLYDQFVLFAESLETLGVQIDRAQSQYQTTYKRLISGRGNLVRRAEAVKKLGAKTKKQLSQDLLDKEGSSPELEFNSEGQTQ